VKQLEGQIEFQMDEQEAQLQQLSDSKQETLEINQKLAVKISELEIQVKEQEIEN